MNRLGVSKRMNATARVSGSVVSTSSQSSATGEIPRENTELYYLRTIDLSSQNLAAWNTCCNVSILNVQFSRVQAGSCRGRVKRRYRDMDPNSCSLLIGMWGVWWNGGSLGRVHGSTDALCPHTHILTSRTSTHSNSNLHLADSH